MKSKFRIGYLSAFGTDDVKAISGTPYFLSRVLNERIATVVSLGSLRPRKITAKWLLANLGSSVSWLFIVNKCEELFWKLLGRSHRWDRTPSVSAWYAQVIKQKLKETPCDVIFADKASIEIACLETEIPILYKSDATFHIMVDYYDEFFHLSPRALRFGEMLEQKALDRAQYFLPCTSWTADSAVRDYGKDCSKVEVIHFHQGLDSMPGPEVLSYIKLGGECRLLFVGIDWVRKGGDIAIAATVALNAMGVRAKLIVCGCNLPARHKNNPYVQEIGFLDKASSVSKKEYDELFLSSHFFILPTRAECMGQVFIDATAYALPVMATDTGGVSDVVVNGVNGFCLSLDSNGYDFAMKIKECWDDQACYESLRKTARALFEDKFSIGVWERKMLKVMENVMNPSGKELKA